MFFICLHKKETVISDSKKFVSTTFEWLDNWYIIKMNSMYLQNKKHTAVLTIWTLFPLQIYKWQWIIDAIPAGSDR